MTSKRTEGGGIQNLRIHMPSTVEVKHVHFKNVGFEIWKRKLCYLAKGILTFSDYES